MTVAYRIEWVDSHAPMGLWYEEATAKEDFRKTSLMCVTIGFVLDENEDSYCIANSYSDIGMYSGMIYIPKCAVKLIEPLHSSLAFAPSS